jgi:tetratricopeptide (TPR) repeat protein
MNKPRPLPPTRFVAFYSYKGGVGRTLALANCARAMAAAGKRVVLLDFDLEAPGLNHFDTLNPGKNTAGFVEYLQACLAGQTPESLDEYVHACPGQEQDRGHAWIMPAGRHGEPPYLDFLNGMNWSAFYNDKAGYLILENLRGHLIEQFRPDYVLMDARTGLSEIGGIATHQLADIVVLLFNLNEQNLQGAERIFHSVKQAPMRPKIILVASPVPAVFTEPGTLFHKKMAHIRSQFVGAENTDKPLVIPYNPLLAFGETIFVDEHDDLFSSDAPYQRLVELVKQAAVVDADICLDKSLEAWRRGDLAKARDILEKAVSENLDDPELWFNLGVLSSSLKEPEKAIEAYSQLVERYGGSDRPRWQELVAMALFNQGFTFGTIGKPDEALATYAQLLERYRDSNRFELQELVAKALRNQGVTFGTIGKPDEALATYAQLLERYGDSDRLELQEQVAKALVNQGNALNAIGKPDEALAAYVQVQELFGGSDRPELQETVAYALVNQGFLQICLAKQAQRSGDGQTFQQRLADAETSLANAQAKMQNHPAWLQNRAYLLYLQGQPTEAETTLRPALQKGGSKVLEDCRQDAALHRLPEDDGFLALVEKLAAEQRSPDVVP